MLAIDIETFRPQSEFVAMLDCLFEQIKVEPKVPGTEEILIPGEPEFRMGEQRRREGIPVPEGVWNAVLTEAEQLGVVPDDINSVWHG